MPSGGLDVLQKAESGEVDPLPSPPTSTTRLQRHRLSSGAVRNHDPEIMVKAFELVRLGEDEKKFPAMYNAFCYGAPPMRARPGHRPHGHAAPARIQSARSFPSR